MRERALVAGARRNDLAPRVRRQHLSFLDRFLMKLRNQSTAHLPEFQSTLDRQQNVAAIGRADVVAGLEVRRVLWTRHDQR